MGLGFGAEFIPIYQNYPGAEIAAICRRSRKDLDECGDRWKIAKRYTEFDEVLNDPEIDAVHINSPIQDHAWQSIAALKAGKHVACTVPMGTTVDECRADRRGPAAAGKVYMMMETVVYSREYLFVKELYEAASSARSSSCARHTSRTWPAGRVLGGPAADVLRDSCVSPCLALASRQAESVACLGSGRISSACTTGTAAVRGRDRPHPVQGQRPRRRGHQEPVDGGPAVPGELRRVRGDPFVRVVAAGR